MSCSSWQGKLLGHKTFEVFLIFSSDSHLVNSLFQAGFGVCLTILDSKFYTVHLYFSSGCNVLCIICDHMSKLPHASDSCKNVMQALSLFVYRMQ